MFVYVRARRMSWYYVSWQRCKSHFLVETYSKMYCFIGKNKMLQHNYWWTDPHMHVIFLLGEVISPSYSTYSHKTLQTLLHGTAMPVSATYPSLPNILCSADTNESLVPRDLSLLLLCKAERMFMLKMLLENSHVLF